MTDIVFSRTHCSRAGFSPVFRCVLLALRFLARALDRYRQRQALAGLDDRRLVDIGLTHSDVRRECARSWWPV